MQQQDWLFALPRAEINAQERIVAAWLAADPAAAAIPDAEAELFCAAAYMVRYFDGGYWTKLCRVANVPVSHTGPKAKRRATLMILRRWKDATVRTFLTDLIPRCGMGAFPDAATQAHRLTDECFARAYQDGLHIMWMIHVRRYLGKARGLQKWLKSLDSFAPRQYKLWLSVGRLTLRRIVYPELGPDRAAQEAAAAVQPELADELRTKDRQSGALRQNVRRLQQDRRHLKDRARRAEQEARTLLTQARGEVAGAHRALKAQWAAQERELAELARKQAGELATLRARLVGARDEFARTLASVVATGPVDLLRGRTVTVDGPSADQGLHRLLVESLGGTVGDGVTIPAWAGFAAFDRQLRSLALERVLIKCDGLYRHREGRAGIAISGFQVHIGDEAAFRASKVVCCGPSAGSLMAEYGAAAMALGWLFAGDPPPGAQVEIWSDCKTMLSRIRRPHPARRKQGCITLDRTVRRLISLLTKRGCDVRLRWVPRDEVYAVDRLCDEAYRAQLWYHRPSRRPHVPLRAFLATVPGFAPAREGTATVPALLALPTGATGARVPSRQRQGPL
ncbi:MAG: hypothetical protein JWN15_2566 [Firmicutes bacterium]|nr:hypothetical protein [Bacillota bacterium]